MWESEFGAIWQPLLNQGFIAGFRSGCLIFSVYSPPYGEIFDRITIPVLDKRPA